MIGIDRQDNDMAEPRPAVKREAGRKPAASLIKSDSLYNLCFVQQTAPAAVCQNGVMDYVLHPIEPLAVRVTLAGAF
jgi:hypothetical protein